MISKNKAKAFSEKWKYKGNEKQDTSTFWLELLSDVLGMKNTFDAVKFEVPVPNLKSTDYKDVPVFCMELVSQRYEEIEGLAKKLGTYWKGESLPQLKNSYLFTQDDGKQMSLSSPSHKFAEIQQYYNEVASKPLPHITLHSLRHTGASILIDEGISVELVAQRLGHSDVKQTLNRYGHAIPDNQHKAVNALNKAFSNGDLKVPLSNEQKQAVLDKVSVLLDECPEIIMSFIENL